MKGFLSLLGITLIVGAFGLILFIFIDNPLEEWKSDEKMYAYIETRQNHSAEITTQNASATEPMIATTHKVTNFYMNMDSSCEKPLRD
ncbi:hypothetical protein QWY14_15710 [Planococcus sp. N028]|uniref:Uncharacterized protein n=1 Tax=Planococcus shixiaomingii TaxID=3058393 RepID=A0ABT8N5T2_9BACL|nr:MULTISPECIES: hypothetical protein [unclassified Planococcus (in: firmicutes)]MDN7243251.1 hypothetical protein [Planococcus sp. N028]WKA55193.1 hypothetical protein QWY21_02075 [Planococcus sp. N022]